MNKIDFTNCKRIAKAYNGANGSKIAVEYNGEVYMLKFPKSAESKPNELSYSNSNYSEHISCSIFNLLGVKAQKTMLGIFHVNGKEKIVCACKDFTSDGNSLFDFCSIKNTIIDSESNGMGTELSDILEAIEKQTFVDPNELLEHFWDMFIVDALLGNFDRHNGNWGFLKNDKTGKFSIAPVFDCGSCLLPQADEKIMKAVISDKKELDARIFTFPRSAIKLNDEKLNYYDFISSMENENCNESLIRIYERINMKEIFDFIDSEQYLSDLQKEFYKTYINARKETILESTYFELMNTKKTKAHTMLGLN